jgi:hypothetical protein
MLQSSIPAADEPEPASYDEAVRRTKSQAGFKNLAQIGLAFHNYHDIFGRFPSAVCYAPDGNTPHSWRVELWPLIERDRGYRHDSNVTDKSVIREAYDAAIAGLGYDMAETWDNEKNRAALQSIPDAYRHPRDNAQSTASGFYVLVGDGTAFESDVVLSYEKYDSVWLSTTMMVAESRSKEPWTKPVDISYSPAAVVPRLGGFDKDGFLTLCCNGAVHWVSDVTSSDDLRAYITRDESDSFQIPGIPHLFD